MLLTLATKSSVTVRTCDSDAASVGFRKIRLPDNRGDNMRTPAWLYSKDAVEDGAACRGATASPTRLPSAYTGAFTHYPDGTGDDGFCCADEHGGARAAFGADFAKGTWLVKVRSVCRSRCSEPL